MIKVLFFASLKEQLGCPSLNFPLNNEVPLTVKNVLSEIIKLNPDWQEHLQKNSLLFAVNQTMANENTPVKQGDDVAIFPPVTGG